MMTGMTSCEIVKRCIEFKAPPRIAMLFATDPIQGKTWDFTDFAWGGYVADVDFRPSRKGQNEWGVIYETLNAASFGQPKSHPLAEGWHKLEAYQFPDFDKPSRYCLSPDLIKQQYNKYVYGPIQPLMMTAMELRGMENWLMDHIASQSELAYLLDRLVDINLKIIDHYAKAGVNGVIVWDDMGVNDRAFVTVSSFKQFYYPRYKKVIDALHEHNMHFIHHCCGWVREYMDLFVEGGWDVLQIDQPNLMGIDWLSDNYGGKLCFWNPVDIQTTIGKNDLSAIDEEACHQVWAFGRYNGGFMVKAYQQPEALGVTIEAIEAQYNAFHKYSTYPLSPYKKRSI
jgi:uroporphyrinogen decarboxylase